MNHDDLELTMQDYLDDRMDPAERAQFEARMVDDPDLAAAVAELAEIGDTLRATEDDLPERFYADTRARFEAERAPRRIHDAFRWESVGLLAAALVVAAILLPVVWKQGLFLSSPPEATKARPTEALGDARVRQDPAVVDEIRVSDAVDAEREESPAAVPFAPSPPDDVVSDRDLAGRKDEKKAAPDREGALAKEKAHEPEPLEEQVESEYEERIASNVPTDAVEPGRRAETVPSPPSTAGADAPAKMSRTRNQAVAESDDKSDAARDNFADAESFGVGQSFGPRGAAIPAGVLPESAVIDVPGADAWKRWLTRVGGLGAERLSPRFPDERVVLIGPRPDPLRCDRIVALPGGNIGVPVSPSEAGDRGGCAVVVPAGGAEIEFLHHEGAR